MNNNNNNNNNDTNKDVEEKFILEPYKYIATMGGKGVRKVFIQTFNSWLKVPPEPLKVITEIIDILHNSSLLIDDIEDNSKLRRGVPVAHLIHGIPATVNSANYMYFVALQKIIEELPKTTSKKEEMAQIRLECCRIFTEELINLHRGQGFDIYWRDNSECPTEEEYKKMVLQKTGGLFRLSVSLMQVFSADKRDFTTLVEAIGLFFQIRDDYLNLQSEEYMQNKFFCEDLTEGKFSFPIVHSLRSSKDEKLLKILKQKTTDLDLKKYALELMNQTKSFQYTKNVIDQEYQKCLEEIEKLGGNEGLVQILEQLKKSNK